MPVKMELHYDHRLITDFGHSIAFVAGVPRDIPDVCVDECLKLGARPIDNDIRTEVPTKPVPKHQLEKVGTDRADAIRGSLAKLKLKNSADDFAGTGRPKIAVVSQDVGFKVDAKEVSRIWDELNGSGDE